MSSSSHTRRSLAVPLLAATVVFTSLGLAGAPDPSPAPNGETTNDDGAVQLTGDDGAQLLQQTQTSQQACAAGVLARMTVNQRVGQLFMVGTPSAGSPVAAERMVAAGQVGSVFLTGRSRLGVSATARLSARLQAKAGTTKLFVATDQEGGSVQVLSGPGFSSIPKATTQGTWPSPTLRQAATTWGRQLKAAGVNLNLAPVADTVPASLGRANQPIGRFSRQYGSTPAVVTAGSGAFSAGMWAAGVAPAVKHFPGLGYVRQNTDTSPVVVDSVTTRTGASLQPFRAAVAAHVPFVMVSSATYSKIDGTAPAAFSPTVIGLLRNDLGFTGVVIGDDMAAAKSMAKYPAGQRAIRFLTAGGDLVLSVTPSAVAQMYPAVLAKARSDTAFRARVDQSALRVLLAKQAQGLLPKTC